MPESKSARGPSTRASRDAVLGVLEAADEPCLTVGMIEDRVEYSRPTVHRRVQELAEEGVIESEKIGSAAGYWHPDAGETEETEETEALFRVAASITEGVSGGIGGLEFEDVSFRLFVSNVAVTATAFLVSLLANIAHFATGSAFAGLVAVGAGVISLAGVVGIYVLTTRDPGGMRLKFERLLGRGKSPDRPLSEAARQELSKSARRELREKRINGKAGIVEGELESAWEYHCAECGDGPDFWGQVPGAPNMAEVGECPACRSSEVVFEEIKVTESDRLLLQL